MNFYNKILTGACLLVIYLFAITCYLMLTDRTVGTYLLFGMTMAGVFYMIYSVSVSKKRNTWGTSFFKVIQRFSFLIEQLVARDFKTKYKRSVIGIFWSFLNPLLMMLVQYAVFSKLMGIRNLTGNANQMLDYYAVYLIIGIVMYNGFNDCCNQAMRSVVYNASLITKVYVPKLIYPTTKVFSACINLLLAIIPMYLIVLCNRLWPNATILLLPVGILFLFVFALGMGYFLASSVVFFRDIEFLWGVIAMMWMYATPIIYDLGALPEIIQKLMVLNPLYHYIDFVRTIVILRQVPSSMEFLYCSLFSAGMFAFGLFVFKKTEDKFIFYI